MPQAIVRKDDRSGGLDFLSQQRNEYEIVYLLHH